MRWWNSAAVRPWRKALRLDLDNLASIARAADEERAREHQAEETAREQHRDRERLEDPFGQIPIRGNGSVKSVVPDRVQVAGAPT